jgi:hypothetical protein
MTRISAAQGPVGCWLGCLVLAAASGSLYSVLLDRGVDAFWLPKILSGLGLLVSRGWPNPARPDS